MLCCGRAARPCKQPSAVGCIEPGQERVQNRMPEQIVDVPVPLLMETIVEVVPSSPQERVRNRKPEQIVDVPVPLLMETIVEVVPSSPQERVQNRTPEQIVDVPVLRIIETIVEQISVVPQTTGKYGHVLRPVLSERIQERLVDVGFIKGLDRYNMPRPGDVMISVPHIMEAAVEAYDPQECVQNRTLERLVDVPVPQIIEAALEVDAPQECVQNRTLEQIVGEPVHPVMEAEVEIDRVTPQECVLNRTPAQLMDEPVPQIAEEIVERPVPSERIHEPFSPPAVLRALQELRRRNLEQNAFQEDEEKEEEEDEEDEEISRFPPHFRPRRWCRFVQAGGVCTRGWQCTFAHHESELHPDSW